MYNHFCVFEVVIVKYSNCAMQNSAVLLCCWQDERSGVIFQERKKTDTKTVLVSLRDSL
jgi:hypothetical protein